MDVVLQRLRELDQHGFTTRPVGSLPATVAGKKPLTRHPATATTPPTSVADLGPAPDAAAVRAMFASRRHAVDVSAPLYLHLVCLERRAEDAALHTAAPNPDFPVTAALHRVDALWESPDSRHFRVPVSAYIAPDYHKAIRTPMSLAAMLDRARDGCYRGPKDVLRDVARIADNAAEYNGEGPIADAARRLHNHAKLFSDEPVDVHAVYCPPELPDAAVPVGAPATSAAASAPVKRTLRLQLKAKAPEPDAGAPEPTSLPVESPREAKPKRTKATTKEPKEPKAPKARATSPSPPPQDPPRRSSRKAGTAAAQPCERCAVLERELKELREEKARLLDALCNISRKPDPVAPAPRAAPQRAPRPRAKRGRSPSPSSSSGSSSSSSSDDGAVASPKGRPAVLAEARPRLDAQRQRLSMLGTASHADMDMWLCDLRGLRTDLRAVVS